MNKFAIWIQNNDKKQRGVAQKLGISTSSLHDILRKGQMPSLKLAYEIEKYTMGAVTVYDWIDQNEKKYPPGHGNRALGYETKAAQIGSLRDQ